jgi:hypothetical protein
MEWLCPGPLVSILIYFRTKKGLIELLTQLGACRTQDRLLLS